MSYIEKTIHISKIEVNKENPRFEPVESEEEAINKLLDTQEDKIYNLAKDIIENGVNPTEKVSIFKSEDLYYLKDGNRRITALKLLNNPDLIDNKYSNLKKKIKSLIKDSNTDIPSKVSAIIFDDEDEADRWVELKHTGENQGVGTVSWDAKQKARFNNKSYPYSSDFISYMGEQNLFTLEVKASIENINISTLERVLGDPDIRKMLSLGMQDKKLRYPSNPEDYSYFYNSLLSDILSEDFTVNKVKSKDDRAQYIEHFKSKYGTPTQSDDLIPKPEPEPPKDTKPDSSNKPKKDSKQKSSNKKENKEENNNEQEVSSRANTQERKTLIPDDYNLHIKNEKINDLFCELKRLDVNKYPNVVSAAFRVFIELSVDYYIEKFEPEDVNYSDKLNIKLEAVKNSVKDLKELDKNDLKDINKVISDKNNIASIDTLHTYIHSRNIQADPIRLKTAWNNYSAFIKYLYT